MSFGVLFSTEFGVDAAWLLERKVFNPTLDVDSPLFIDPFLLSGSVHPEFSDGAFSAYEGHFSTICSILLNSEQEDDKLWKGALQRFQFSEAAGLTGTCLGYSKHSTNGRAFGTVLSLRSIRWANSVVKLGVKDPELFSAMSLFEENIGADRISDMVTKIALPNIVAFNHRIIAEARRELGLELKTSSQKIGTCEGEMLVNPYSGDAVILLAADVLKHLPIFDDPKTVAVAAAQNQELRQRVNDHISEIFKIRTKREKE